MNYKKLNKITNDFIVESEFRRIEQMLIDDPNSKAFYVTVGFNQSRFGYISKNYYRKSDLVRKISEKAPLIRDLFRYWYLTCMLRYCFKNFRKNHCKNKWPFALCYIDNNDLNDSRPHVHSIIVAKTERTQWYLRDMFNLNWQWKRLESKGSIYSQRLPIEDIKSANFYSSKSARKYGDYDFHPELSFVFPEHTPDDWRCTNSGLFVPAHRR